MEFCIEKRAMLVMSSGKGQITVGTELSNQERIRTIEEKVNYKALGILEVDTIKQEIFLKSVSDEWGNYSTPGFLAGVASNE